MMERLSIGEAGKPFSLRSFLSGVRRSVYIAEEKAKLPKGYGLRRKLRVIGSSVAKSFAFLEPPVGALIDRSRFLQAAVRYGRQASSTAAKWASQTIALARHLWIKIVTRTASFVVTKLFSNKQLVRRFVQLFIPQKETLAVGSLGRRAISLSQKLIERDIPIVSRASRKGVELSLVSLLGSQMAIGDVGNTLLLARLANLSFRPYVRGRKPPLSFLYFQALFHARLYQRVVAQIPPTENFTSHYMNHIVGASHLFCGNPNVAVRYLEEAILLLSTYYLDYRMLGRAYLMLGDEARAAAAFKTSVELAPWSVMAHQNYAGRYDIPNYRPKHWELEAADKLLCYDNLCQLAEEYFLLGNFDLSFKCYQKMLDTQNSLQPLFLLPRRIVERLKRAHPEFNAAKPTRILPYEWVTQFGHIGLLDSYIKMARMGMYPDANYVLLAPKDKVANAHYLAYWRDFFIVVEEEALVDDLFPYQRAIGDNFMAYPGGGGLAEPWTRAAARAQAEWARRGHAPLLSISKQDRAAGLESLRGLGLPEGAWYVGLHVREGGYYGESRGGMSTHRNSEIGDYLAAVKAITDAGGYVIRLGDKSMQPLKAVPGLIDYALSREKSASMDIFLCATSRFVIGTTSGLTTACISFGTPMLLVNCISNDWQLWSGNTDFVLKRIWDRRDKRFLTLAEAFSMPVQGYLINSHTMRRHGLEAIANHSDEITDAVRYKLALADGLINRSDERAEPMRRYLDAMAHNSMMFGGAYPVVPWLERYPELVRAPATFSSEFKPVGVSA